MDYNINDLPNSCYTVQPSSEGQLDRGLETSVILVCKGEKGYWNSDLVVNSRKGLAELNKARFNIEDINIIRILRDFSVFGHYGLLSILNEKEGK